MNVTVVCFGFKPSNLRKQPWRYVHELVKELPDSGIDLTVVTDADRTETAGLPVTTVDRILGLSGPTAEVVAAVEAGNPDIVVTLVGPTSFLRASTIASEVDSPTVGLVAGPLYSLSEVLGVGVTELYRNYRQLAAPLAGSLAPAPSVRAHSSAFAHLVTLTHENGRRLRQVGVGTRLSTIKPGVDDFDLRLPPGPEVDRVRNELSPEGVPLVLYFTSPLTLRGTDTLVEAFARVRRTHPCRLVVLSRQDDGGLTREEDRLRRLAARRSVTESFELVPRDLSPDGVKAHLAAADVVALPFKILLASVPLSVLEAMSAGNPVLSTTVAGLPEVADDDRQLVAPGDPSSLARALEPFVADAERREAVGARNRERMHRYQRWDDARAQFRTVLEDCV
jgi:glycosyltransferase involved in cell wall biosynthesis